MNKPLFAIADFVIVTALEEERDAVLTKLPNPRRMPLSTQDTRTCFGALLPITFDDGSSGMYNVVVQCLADMGTTPAATATSDAIRRWKPVGVLVVGIAGGFEKNDVRLGDVLVATQVVDYSQQKLTDEKRQFRFKGYQVSERLNGFALNLLEVEWQSRVTVPRPEDGVPKRWRGPVASGPTVAQQTLLIEELLHHFPKLVGLEMEAAGVVAATSESVDKPEFFMVRGVSDLCDQARESNEVKSWRSYACDVAASYAIALLQHGPMPSRNAPRQRRGLPPLPPDDEPDADQPSSVWSDFHRKHALFVRERVAEACEYIEERLSAPTDDDRDLMRLYLQRFIPHRPHLVWSSYMWAGASWGDGITEESFERLFVAKRDVYPLSYLQSHPSDREDGTSPLMADLQRETRRKQQTVSLEDAVSRHRKLVLLGDPGAGKTTSLRQLALEVQHKSIRTVVDEKDENGAIHEVTVDAPDFLVIPVLVELRRYKSEAELETLIARSINDVLKAEGEALGADEAESVRRLKTWLLHPGAHFLLLFDGLNEVERTHHVAARSALRSVLNYPHSVVVSCREYDYDDSLQEAAVAYCLESLPDEAIRDFLTWFLEGKTPHRSWDFGKTLFEELESNERLLSLARNPLLLRLIGEVAWESPHTSLPKNRAQLFERFITVMPQRRRQEGMDMGVSNYKVRAALRQLGAAMHERDRIKADLEEVHRWLPLADDAFDLALRQAQEWRLMESDGGRGCGVEFIHPLFVEFFAADAMADRLRRGESPNEVIDERAFDPRWRETLLLLSGLTDEPESLVVWLAGEARRTTNAQMALLAHQVALLTLPHSPQELRSDSTSTRTNDPKRAALDDAVLDAMLSVLNNPDNLEPFHKTSIHEHEYNTWQQQRDDVGAIEQEVSARQKAAQPVMMMFTSEDERLLACAARMLAQIQLPVVEPLLDLLQNPQTSADLRRRTIEVLKEIGDWRVSLKDAAKAHERALLGRETANQSGICWQHGRVRMGTSEQLREQNIEAEQQLLAELEGYDEPPGLWQKRMTLLEELSHDPDPQVRVAAVQALGKTRQYHFHKSDHPVEGVLEATTDTDAQVRHHAIDALGWWMRTSQQCEWWDDAAVLVTIFRALRDPDERVRHCAIQALKLTPGEESAQQLIALLSHTDPDMRLSSIRALEERREMSAIPALEHLLSDDTEVVRMGSTPLAYTQKVSTEAADAIRSIRRFH